MKKTQITVEGTAISVLESEYMSLTDIARHFDQEDPRELINNWMRLKDTVELIGAWEVLHNPDFKRVEFDTIKNQAGSNRFRLSPTKWTETTGAIGFAVKRGRYDSGTFAHNDLALAFCAWVNPVFHLYVVKEFRRLKSLENPEWDMRRALTKVNYSLHTGAIREHIVPALKGNPSPAEYTAFSEEADMLNEAVFGMTAAQWRTENPEAVAQSRNIRDTADIYQLLVLANLEAYNEVLISHAVPKFERHQELRRTAERQLAALYSMNRLPFEAIQSPLQLAAAQALTSDSED
ncbi:MAG: KilA-N domain-containing protein [Saprospiraceae bacterium]